MPDYVHRDPGLCWHLSWKRNLSILKIRKLCNATDVLEVEESFAKGPDKKPAMSTQAKPPFAAMRSADCAARAAQLHLAPLRTWPFWHCSGTFATGSVERMMLPYVPFHLHFHAARVLTAVDPWDWAFYPANMQAQLERLWSAWCSVKCGLLAEPLL